MKIRYIGPFGNQTGYARAGHDYLLALHMYRPDVELDIQSTHPDWSPDDLEECYRPLLEYYEVQGDLNWPDVVLVHTIPYGAERYVTGDLKPDDSVRKVCMTTWETDQLPERMAATLRDNFDVVIAPSRWCEWVLAKALNRDAWAATQVCCVPHCYDSKTWPFKRYFSANELYTFYWIGAWCERKNPIGLLKAYMTEFKPEDDVKLVIKTGKSAPALAEIAALKRCLNLEDYPPIELVQDFLSRKELQELHMECDCYVSLHRGEGFGLGAFEAACTGNPVIATDWSGTNEFTGRRHRVGYQMTPAVVPEQVTYKKLADGRMAGRAVRKDPTGMDGSQNWAEPHLVEAKALMRKRFENRGVAQSGDVDLTRFDYKAIADALVEACEG